MSPRPGFTLIEVIAAILLIDVGLLALVAGSAALMRQTNDVRARTAALRTAANRIEEIGAPGCGPASGQALLAGGGREIWAVDSLGNSTSELRDSVVYIARGEAHSVVLRTRRPC